MTSKVTIYRKKYSKGKKYWGPYKTINKPVSNAKINTAIKAVKKIQRGMEKKFVHYDVVQTWSQAGAMTDIFGTSLLPTQGTSDSQRIGDKIEYRSIHIKHDIAISGGGNQPPIFHSFRCILFYWIPNDTGGAAPTTADILLAAAGGVGTAFNLLTPYVVDQRSLFKVIYDKTFLLDSGGTGLNKMIHIKKKLTGLCKFEAGSLSGMRKLYMLCLTDAGLAVTSNTDWMVRYTDA